MKRLDIQGLRAVAVILVVLFHAGIPGFDGGYVGVDVFFVISGFLISGHLAKSLDKSGGIKFADFYARRARRLLPAALTVIAGTVIIALFIVSPIQFPIVVRDAISATLYVPNVLFAYFATDYLADNTPSLFLHYWSLGVEEQFYLAWPIALLVLYKIAARRRLAALTIGVIAIAGISFIACLWLTANKQPYAFFLLPARIWEFAVGALVALALVRPVRLPSLPAAVLGWVGLATVLVSAALMSPLTLYPGYAVALPVLGTALVIMAGASETAWGPTALLSRRPATFIGDISYSLYLVHWPAMVLPFAAYGYMVSIPLWVRCLIAAACVPLAWLMYKYVELPGQRIKWLTTRPRHTLTAAAASMVVVLAITGASSIAPINRLDAGREAPTARLSPLPIGTGYVPANPKPSLTAAISDKPSVYVDGCHLSEDDTEPVACRSGDNPAAPLVFLFGDSHAAQWYPALEWLAARGLIRVESHTKSACPSARPSTLENYPQCDVWREAVLTQLEAARPALILVGNYVRHYYPEPDGADWARALTESRARMPLGSRVAVLADTPSYGITPTFCLGKYPDSPERCTPPKSVTLTPISLRQGEIEFVRATGTAYIDLTEMFCNSYNCPSIIGDTLVYRDDHHVTTRFIAELTDTLWARIEPLIARQHVSAHK